MAIRTLNQIVGEFKEIADQHRQINNFTVGTIEDFATSGTTNYPAWWVSYQNNGFEDRRENFSFSFWVVDRVKKDRSNLIEVHSDMKQIAMDIIAQLNDSAYKWSIDSNISLSAIYEPFHEDEIAGWTFDVTISQAFTKDVCQIPFINPPTVGRSQSGYNPNTPVFNVVPNYRQLTINGVTYDLSEDRTWTIASSGTTGVSSVQLTAGTGISLSGTNPITSTGNITVTNSAPDQTVSLTAGSGISVSGTYPSFTINNTATTGGLKSGTATASVTDVYTTTISGVTAYTTNDAYVIKFNTANSNGATININGLGAVQLTKNNNVILTGGDITVGQEFIIIYDGTNFQILGIAPNQMFAYVTNADSVTITKGQPVYAFGASGDRMSVKLANNTFESTSSKTVGLVFSSSIPAGGLGFIITQGVLSNVNTASYTAGDTLYVGSSAGTLTNVLPTAPNHLTRIGIVERTNAGNGLIYVLVQNGFQLDELSDVDITSVAPVNNDILTYITGTNNLWKPRSIATILGYTPVTNARTLTINGTSYDLTANRTWSVGTVTSVTGTLPISSSGGATPDISIAQATGTTDGYLTAEDWTTFNEKQNALTFTPEDTANKSSSYTASSTTTYANTKALVDGLATKQNTLTNPITGTGTNNEIAYFNTTGSTISSLTTATYPSLTELSYVKGVTSAIQTQLSAKPSQDTFVLQFYHGGAFSPADSTTYYFTYSSNAIGTAAANVDMNLGYAFKIVGVQLFIAGNTTAGTNENVTLQVRNVTQATSSSVGTYQTNASSATATANFTFTGLNISIGSGDSFCLQVDTPAWATNPVSCNHRANIICERQ